MQIIWADLTDQFVKLGPASKPFRNTIESLDYKNTVNQEH